ncbi:hypothetical protein E4T81_04550 [Barnesiella sp. WM24]|uniref:hypothetical protein n=1 Tax=Barnesiella sp. WM24 TaxID=2558278 RepID=UPI001072A1ED|nr:hypothetical protein [Barnesiella sp. WM24]MDE6113622.1 hypothetical protein [Muribaculum sp.]TFU94517.1 hypothetical protein E4T81_04550 [Barnesiella sp. WM24]
MANKRKLKKAIKAACGNMAGECIMTRNYVPGVDTRKMDEIIFSIADLQFSSIENVSFSFDKSEKSFSSRHEYKKAREAYFHKGYKKLIDDFKKGVDQIVGLMNEALPAEQKERNKAAAK